MISGKNNVFTKAGNTALDVGKKETDSVGEMAKDLEEKIFRRRRSGIQCTGQAFAKDHLVNLL